MTSTGSIGEGTVPRKIACFDLDHTLICPKNNRVHPKLYRSSAIASLCVLIAPKPGAIKTDIDVKNRDDWMWLDPKVPMKLVDLIKQSYIIVVFSNQSKFNIEIQTKLENVFSDLTKRNNGEFDFIVLCSVAHTIYRKPMTGMFDLVNTMFAISDADADRFYVGDAIDSGLDFSNSDLCFAHNANLPFYYTPHYFNLTGHANFTRTVPALTLPVGLRRENVENGKTAEEFIALNKICEWNAIILIGPPACGKSTFANTLGTMYGYEILNLDTLKTAAKFNKAFAACLTNGKKIVIDNTNKTIAKRKELVTKFYEHNTNATGSGTTYKILYVEFENTDKHTLHYLNCYRCTETGKFIPSVVYNLWHGQYQKPDIDIEQKMNESAAAANIHITVLKYNPKYTNIDLSKFY
jgi:bifunctional polynucleotide phosphatase/kinase